VGSVLAYGLVTGKMVVGFGAQFKRKENDYGFWSGAIFLAALTVMCIYFGLGF